MQMTSHCEGAVVGQTPEILKIYQIVHTAARTLHPVLIVGEGGTGKEVIARAIHSASARSRMPFRVMNCMTVRAIDLEREIFGASEICGPHEEVHAGTLFLNQIVYLSLDLQGTLLRAIQQAETNDDDHAPRRQARIMAASTRDLQSAVAEGLFRRDLYFRLNALTLRIPPLRERRRDIPLLANSILNKLSEEAQREYRLSDEVLQALLTYEWRGNVRELESCLQHACCSADGSTIHLTDLPSELTGTNERTNVQSSTMRVVPLSELERQSIEDALRMVGGHIQTAAKLLGIGKSTLYRKLKEYESLTQRI
jgi:DNA-binding NtrC family response regulator